MQITIHRGADKIGGIIVEYKANNGKKLFVDIGKALQGDHTPFPENIDGLTCGNCADNALFFTHIHPDHIGELEHAYVKIGHAESDKDHVPVYMGKLSKEIETIINDKKKRGGDLFGIDLVTDRYCDIIKNAYTFKTGEILRDIPKGFKITPIPVDHSCFDAHMFFIEADGVTVLHTGDFRTHGERSQDELCLDETLKPYIGKVDYIVCEGTNISYDEPISEKELRVQIKDAIYGKKYIFVFCSSTNIDRIVSLYEANREDNYKRLFLADDLQQKILRVINRKFPDNKRYGFESASKKINAEELRNSGFMALIRGNGSRWENSLFIDEFTKSPDALFIYSMWEGYLEEQNEAKNDNHIGLLNNFCPIDQNGTRKNFKHLHTSGHASRKAIRRLYDIIQPNKGLIPMHTQAPEKFKDLISDGNVIILNNGIQQAL